MKKKLTSFLKTVICFVLIFLLSFVCVYFYLNMQNSEETQTISTVKKVDTQPLIIDIPEVCNTGSLTVKDADENIYFNYNGVINIQNDGKDGEQIEIEIIVPSEEETESMDDN